MRTSTRTARLTAATLALVLVASACGGGRDDDTAAEGPSGTSAERDVAEGAFTIDTDECAEYNPTQGVTDDKITFGSSFAQAGIYAPYSDISKGWNAYFSYVNEEEGGVDGRQIEVVTADDGYIDPTRTAANVEGFVEDDGVFGIFNVVGTPNNIAIRDELAENCVPNLFTATGSQLFGDPDAYPWTIGSIPAYATEAAVFAEYLQENFPEAQVGILRQNDDFGEGYYEPFLKAIAGTDISVVSDQSYNPGEADVSSQITAIRNAGADTVLLAASSLACPTALQAIGGQSGWEPTTYMSATCASRTLIGVAGADAVGALSAIYLKEPANPEYAEDPDVVEFQELGARYGLSDADLENGTVLYGWTVGQLLVETLKLSPELTRQSVMETAYSLDGIELPLLLPGMTITTNGAEDPFAIESMRMAEWVGDHFQFVDEIRSFEGQTKQFVAD